MSKQRNSGVVSSVLSIILLPVLMLISASAPAETYYFHNDHLGTPQVVTDQNQEVVWKGEYDPFGKVTETVVLVEQNLRFPGQYFDVETGLHYNYFRSYDPGTGRYVESDPIGLDGGINTFSYVANNPIKLADPSGLSFHEAAPPPKIPGGPWRWQADPDNPRGGRFEGKDGARANWDPSGHWDVNNGTERKRYDRWGNETDRHRNPKRKKSDFPIKNTANLLKRCVAFFSPGLAAALTRNTHTDACSLQSAADVPFCD